MSGLVLCANEMAHGKERWRFPELRLWLAIARNEARRDDPGSGTDLLQRRSVRRGTGRAKDGWGGLVEAWTCGLGGRTRTNTDGQGRGGDFAPLSVLTTTNSMLN